MPKCAVVQQSDNTCINLIVADVTDPAPIGSFLVDVSDMACDIGWIYDSSTDSFVDPYPPPIQPEEPVQPEEPAQVTEV